MSEKYTEVTTQGWGSRIGGSIKGIITGLIMFFIAFPLLFWNEGRAVDRIKTLEEGSGSVISISADSIDPVNDQKLVHVIAKASTDDILTDSDFNVSANAIKLRRIVKTYQWKQNTQTNKEKQLGGGEKTTTEYTYTKVWQSRLINSDNFKLAEHKNPKAVPFKNFSTQAQNVSYGAFAFPDSLTHKMARYKPINIDAELLSPSQKAKDIAPYNGGYYIGSDPLEPEIGDMKIHFEIVEPATVSIVAQQIGNTFSPYSTKAGGDILLLEYGAISSNKIFKSALSSNTIFTWILRIIGLFLMATGLSMILKPLSVLADVLPILGNIVAAGTGLIAGLIALVLTTITIAIAWLFFRPLIAGAIILIAVAACWFLRSKMKKGKDIANENASEEPVAS